MPPTRPESEEDRPAPPPSPAPQAAHGRSPEHPRTTPVTGAAAVAGRIEVLLHQCRRQRGALSLLCVGVDLMELPAGTLTPNLEHRVREEVSHRIGNAVRASDTILRESERDAWVVLPGDAAAAARVAKRLARLLNGDYRVAGELIRVGVRIGVASQPDHGDRAPALMQRATDCR